MTTTTDRKLSSRERKIEAATKRLLRVQANLDKLPAWSEERTLIFIEMHDELGMSFRKIADILSVSPEAVAQAIRLREQRLAKEADKAS